MVTLPLGVLKAAPDDLGAVRFNPLPPALRAAERLEVSHACKVVLRFTKAFWDEPGFLGVGGLPAQRALARPVQRTLFFAGEATEPEEMGTVAGAIASGHRAARQVLRAPGRSG